MFGLTICFSIYGGRKKSCMDGWNPINHGMSSTFQLVIRISQPSTVCPPWFFTMWRLPKSWWYLKSSSIVDCEFPWNKPSSELGVPPLSELETTMWPLAAPGDVQNVVPQVPGASESRARLQGSVPRVSEWKFAKIPSAKLTVCYWKWPFLVDIPKNCDFPWLG